MTMYGNLFVTARRIGTSLGTVSRCGYCIGCCSMRSMVSWRTRKKRRPSPDCRRSYHRPAAWASRFARSKSRTGRLTAATFHSSRLRSLESLRANRPLSTRLASMLRSVLALRWPKPRRLPRQPARQKPVNRQNKWRPGNKHGSMRRIATCIAPPAWLARSKCFRLAARSSYSSPRFQCWFADYF